MKFFYFIFILLFFTKIVYSQLEYSTDIDQMDRLRIHQILGRDSSHLSFAIRDASILNSNNTLSPYFKIKNLYFKGGFQFQFRHNNKLGLGSNDGNLLPSVGRANKLQFNLHTHFWNFHFNFSPDFYYADNEEPVDFVPDSTDRNYFARYYLY